MAMKKIHLLLAVLLGLSWALPATATDDAAAAYLPLAVGNSWTYVHDYYDLDSQWDDQIQRYPAYYRFSPLDESTQLPKFTITVQGTEVIDGKTYYVLSDMPANWPPAPPYFIAGKKLRWKGTHLMERTAEGERSVFRFDGANDAGYTVEPGGTDIIKVRPSSPDPLLAPLFEFRDTEQGNGSCAFHKNYGCVSCESAIFPGSDSYPVFENFVVSFWAVLGGRTVEYKDLLTPTSTNIPSSSWGQVKEEVD